MLISGHLESLDLLTNFQKYLTQKTKPCLDVYSKIILIDESQAASHKSRFNNDLHNHHPHPTLTLSSLPIQTPSTHSLFHISLFETSYSNLLSLIFTILSLNSPSYSQHSLLSSLSLSHLSLSYSLSLNPFSHPSTPSLPPFFSSPPSRLIPPITPSHNPPLLSLPSPPPPPPLNSSSPPSYPSIFCLFQTSFGSCSCLRWCGLLALVRVLFCWYVFGVGRGMVGEGWWGVDEGFGGMGLLGGVLRRWGEGERGGGM